MATESLIIALDADTAKLDSSLSKTDKKLESLDKQTKKNDKSFASLSKVAAGVGTALTATATAGLALATALTAVVVQSAQSQQELTILSRQAKLSTENFEALAFATKQYGINAEQIADISKDMSDKLGEFATAGTGAFQDFANVTGLTTEQAQALAVELQDMSSDQVIGELVSRMEAAGATTNDMTFALESMGNDLSRLIPLFVNGSKELKTMMTVYADATKQMQLSAGEIDDLQEAATSFDLMTDSLSKAGTLISSQIAPLLSEFFSGVINVVPDATQTIINFINSFRADEADKNLDSINEKIEVAKARISELRQETTRLSSVDSEWGGMQASAAERIRQANIEVTEQEDRLDSLLKKKKELEAQEVADAERLSGGDITATGGDGGAVGTGDEVQAILDRFKTEEELLIEKYTREKEILESHHIDTEDLEFEHLQRLAEMRQEAREEEESREEELSSFFSGVADDDIDTINKKNEQKKKDDENYYGAAMTLGGALFEDNKAVKAGMVVVDAAAGIQKAFAELPYPAAIAASAQIAATGVAQLAAIQSASKGGGSVSSSTASSVDTDAETTDLTVSSVDVSGATESQTFTINVEADDSEVATALSSILSNATVTGVI